MKKDNVLRVNRKMVEIDISGDEAVRIDEDENQVDCANCGFSFEDDGELCECPVCVEVCEMYGVDVMLAGSTSHPEEFAIAREKVTKRTHKFDVGEKVIIHLWASFHCVIVAQTIKRGYPDFPTYTVKVDDEFERKFYDVTESHIFRTAEEWREWLSQ